MVEAWLVPLRRFWSIYVNALESHLDRTSTAERATRAKKTLKENGGSNRKCNKGEADENQSD
jgi:hypothetical protein